MKQFRLIGVSNKDEKIIGVWIDCDTRSINVITRAVKAFNHQFKHWELEYR